MRRFLSLVVALTIGGGAFLLSGYTGQVDPAKAVAELNDLRATRMKEARDSGTRLNTAELNREIEAKAKEYCKDVDAKKIEPKDGLAWAQLFVMAKQSQDACDAAQRFLSLNPSGKPKFDAQKIILDSCKELGDTVLLYSTLQATAPPNKTDARTLGVQAAYYYADLIAKEKGVDAAIQMLGEVDAKIPYDEFSGENEKPMADGVRVVIAGKIASLLAHSGRRDKALAVLDRAIEAIGPESRSLKSANSQRTQISLFSMSAPELVSERSHGGFEGLESFRGKVVILDFFAHW